MILVDVADIADNGLNWGSGMWARKPKRGLKPKHQSQMDVHYANMQYEIRLLFQAISLAM